MKTSMTMALTVPFHHRRLTQFGEIRFSSASSPERLQCSLSSRCGVGPTSSFHILPHQREEFRMMETQMIKLIMMVAMKEMKRIENEDLFGGYWLGRCWTY